MARASRSKRFENCSFDTLSGDDAVKPRVASPIDVSPTARAQVGFDLVGAELRADPCLHNPCLRDGCGLRDGRIGKQVRGCLHCRPLHDTLAAVLGQQRLHLAAKLLIAAAGFGKESITLARRALPRRVVYLFDLLQAFGSVLKVR
jgi:hypothetical protein